jgi:hypothetical protein
VKPRLVCWKATVMQRWWNYVWDPVRDVSKELSTRIKIKIMMNLHPSRPSPWSLMEADAPTPSTIEKPRRINQEDL